MTGEKDLKAAIAALEAQRAELGSSIVDIAIEPLKVRLDVLKNQVLAQEPEKRLKQVTVLIADIVGSTVMARQLDPEDTQKIIDGSLSKLSNIIGNYHGRVLQYAGDSLLAAFGADESHEEDPENAVRAGLALIELAQDMSKNIETNYGLKGFSIRVGINTGRVLLGGGVDAENSISGITVHIAARMEQSAPVRGLRISHNTYRHIRGIFDVVEQSPIEVKGLDKPISTYLVQSIKPRAFHSRSRGIDGIETRMIGREAELLQLQQNFLTLCNKKIIHHPAAVTITIVAEAGIGKSRLLYEFENWTDSRADSYYLFKGRAQPHTRQQAYGLLYDILAWRLQISESDSAEVAREKFSEKIAMYFDSDEADQIDILGHLVGLDFSSSPHLRGVLDNSQQIRNRGFYAAAHIIRSLSQQGDIPVVLILDDLQWADDDSLDFLDYLLDINRDVPMLILAMSRPELYERRPQWPASDTSPKRINLQSLNSKQSHELARELLQRLGKIPVAMQELVTRKTDGNPFYMEELIKMLIDDGAIISDVKEWKLVPEKILDTHVPDTLTGVLQARLDNLSAAERVTLQRASVIGFVFWDHILAALDENCMSSLPKLVQRELIVPQTDSVFEGAKEYRFHHHILYQVTYDSLLKDDRKSFHLGTAIWFEKLIKTRSGDYSGVIANHFKQACEISRASHYYTLAAADAASRHGRDATLHYVQQALALIENDDHDLRWQLLCSREKILATHEDRFEHEADLDALQVTADALDADDFRAEALLRKARALSSAGKYPSAEEVSRLALKFARDSGALIVAAHATGTLSFSLRRMGDFYAAQMIAQEGLRLARESGDQNAEGELLTNLASLAAESGNLVECFRLGEQYLAITRETGDRAGETRALNTLGDNSLRLGDYTVAKSYFEEALSLSRIIAHRSSESIVLLNLAAIANLQNDYSTAIEFSNNSIAISSQSSMRDLEAAALLQLGLARIELDEMEKARTALERSRNIFEENFGIHLTMEPIAGLAYLSFREGNIKAAIEHVEKVLQYLENGGSLDGTEEPLRIRWTLYEVLQHSGDIRAYALLAETHRQLHERADKISDVNSRHIFLENVPHNRAIDTAWKNNL